MNREEQEAIIREDFKALRDKYQYCRDMINKPRDDGHAARLLKAYGRAYLLEMARSEERLNALEKDTLSMAPEDFEKRFEKYKEAVASHDAAADLTMTIFDFGDEMRKSEGV